jgi:hypothetical protein
MQQPPPTSKAPPAPVHKNPHFLRSSVTTAVPANSVSGTPINNDTIVHKSAKQLNTKYTTTHQIDVNLAVSQATSHKVPLDIDPVPHKDPQVPHENSQVPHKDSQVHHKDPLVQINTDPLPPLHTAVASPNHSESSSDSNEDADSEAEQLSPVDEHNFDFTDDMAAADHTLVPEPFTGTPSEDAARWLHRYTHYTSFRNLNDEQKLAALPLMLRGGIIRLV